MNVLIAEDDLTMRQMMAIMLSRKEIPCTMAENGKMAVEAWERGDFSVIFMDIQMPEIDGLEATRIIRERERRKGGHVIIVAITAHAMPADKERCRQAGMDEYLSKPFNFDEFYSLLERYCGGAGLPG